VDFFCGCKFVDIGLVSNEGDGELIELNNQFFRLNQEEINKLIENRIPFAYLCAFSDPFCPSVPVFIKVPVN
jgi:hypothetical protein